MWVMRHITAREASRRAREIYDRDIAPRVEPEHRGRFLVVDVDSGRYALADDELEAFDRARAQAPEGVLYLFRIGQRAAHRVGARRVG